MIAVIDYGMGNVGSLLNMFKRIGAEATLTRSPEVIRDAEKVVLPGVGAFDAGMEALHRFDLVNILNEHVRDAGKWTIGICLGMQLLSKGSEEGKQEGLGWIDAVTRRFGDEVAAAGLPVPHMGWNTVEVESASPLFPSAGNDQRFYFVHSFHVSCNDRSLSCGETDYAERFTSVVHKGRLLGVQFHPEKSHRFGMDLLRNFVALENG